MSENESKPKDSEKEPSKPKSKVKKVSKKKKDSKSSKVKKTTAKKSTDQSNESSVDCITIINELSGLFRDKIQSKISETGLTFSQYSVIEILTQGSLGQKDIAKRVGCTGGNMTMIVDNLQKKGYVARERDSEDRRKVFVSLTDEGEVVSKSVCSKVKRFKTDFVNRMPKQVKDALEGLRNELL